MPALAISPNTAWQEMQFASIHPSVTHVQEPGTVLLSKAMNVLPKEALHTIGAVPIWSTIDAVLLSEGW